MKNKSLSLVVALTLISAFAVRNALSQQSPAPQHCDSSKTAMHCEKKADGGGCEKAGETCRKAAMTCPVSGEPANKDIFSEYKGRKVFFCCADCKAAFDKDPEKYAAKIHVCGDSCKAEMKEGCMKHEGKGECGKQEGKPCCKAAFTDPVSGNEGKKEFVSEYKGQKVFFACADCKAAFDKDPEKYAAKIHVCGDSCKAEMKEGCMKHKDKSEGVEHEEKKLEK
jgi:YHS domain-containing protein